MLFAHSLKENNPCMKVFLVSGKPSKIKDTDRVKYPDKFEDIDKFEVNGISLQRIHKSVHEPKDAAYEYVESTDIEDKFSPKGDWAQKNPLWRGVAFMTYDRAIGVNMQEFDTIIILNIDSDIQTVIQALGRIDRVNQKSNRIHYYLLDAPIDSKFPSDTKVVQRAVEHSIIAGIGGLDPDDAYEDPLEVLRLVMQMIQAHPEAKKPQKMDSHAKMHRYLLLDKETRKVFREVAELKKTPDVWGAKVKMTRLKTRKGAEPFYIVTLNNPALAGNGWHLPPTRVRFSSHGGPS